MEIIETAPAVFGIERFIEKPRRFAVCFKNPLAQRRHTVVVCILGHIKPRTLGKKLDRVDVVEVFDFHYKGDNITAYPAAEAVERAVLGVDIE